MKLRKIYILIAFAVTIFKGFDLQAQEVAVTLNVATAGPSKQPIKLESMFLLIKFIWLE